MGERSSLDVGHDDELGCPQGVLGFLGERELAEAGGAGVARVGVVFEATNGGVIGQMWERHWVGAGVRRLKLDP